MLERGNFYITIYKKEKGKQKRYFLEEVSGLIDNELNVGFVYDTEFKQFTATDLNTGNSIMSGCQESLEYFMNAFYDEFSSKIIKYRNNYGYGDMCKVFNILKKYNTPMTTRKISDLLQKS